MDAHFWWTMATSPFILWVAAVLVMLTSPGGSYVRKTGSEILYGRPSQQIIFALLVALSCLWMVCLLWNTPNRWVMVGVSGFLALFFLWGFQPYTLQVDLDRRTYRLTRGWPLLQRHWSGSLNDVVRMVARDGKNNTFLSVEWKALRPRGSRPRVSLGSYRSQQAAQAAAAEVQEAWGIRVPVARW